MALSRCKVCDRLVTIVQIPPLIPRPPGDRRAEWAPVDHVDATGQTCAGVGKPL